MQYRRKIHTLITALHHKKDAQTRQMLGEFWKVIRALPSSVPTLDQMGYHMPDMKANTIIVWIMRYLLHPKINRKTSYQSRSATERRFAVQFLSVCMGSHLAAEQITSKPTYVETQVAQAINEILRPHTALQSRSIAKRLYATFEPIYRHFLETHKKDIHSTSRN
jgi:glutamine synthetase adenylyltransferase